VNPPEEGALKPPVGAPLLPPNPAEPPNPVEGCAALPKPNPVDVGAAAGAGVAAAWLPNWKGLDEAAITGDCAGDELNAKLKPPAAGAGAAGVPKPVACCPPKPVAAGAAAGVVPKTKGLGLDGAVWAWGAAPKGLDGAAAGLLNPKLGVAGAGAAGVAPNPDAPVPVVAPKLKEETAGDAGVEAVGVPNGLNGVEAAGTAAGVVLELPKLNVEAAVAAGGAGAAPNAGEAGLAGSAGLLKLKPPKVGAGAGAAGVGAATGVDGLEPNNGAGAAAAGAAVLGAPNENAGLAGAASVPAA
jgi:hypothetical protein